MWKSQSPGPHNVNLFVDKVFKNYIFKEMIMLKWALGWGSYPILVVQLPEERGTRDMHAQRDGWPSEDTIINQLSTSQMRGPSGTNFAGTLTLTSQLSDLWENKFLLFKPPIVFCYNSSSKLIGALWTYLQQNFSLIMWFSLSPYVSVYLTVSRYNFIIGNSVKLQQDLWCTFP